MYQMRRTALRLIRLPPIFTRVRTLHRTVPFNKDFRYRSPPPPLPQCCPRQRGRRVVRNSRVGIVRSFFVHLPKINATQRGFAHVSRRRVKNAGHRCSGEACQRPVALLLLRLLRDAERAARTDAVVDAAVGAAAAGVAVAVAVAVFPSQDSAGRRMRSRLPLRGRRRGGRLPRCVWKTRARPPWASGDGRRRVGATFGRSSQGRARRCRRRSWTCGRTTRGCTC